MTGQPTTERRAQSPPRRQRACIPCSKAKARCNFQERNVERHLCDRCEKNGIRCSAKSTQALRKTRQIKPLKSRVSNLEKQLETLTAALEIQNGGASQGQGVLSSPTPPCARAAEPARPMFTPESTATHAGSSQLQEHEGAGSPPDPHLDLICGLTWPQVERILDIFRDRFMDNFPFVVIGPGMTGRQLYAEKPFLFRVVMLMAAPLPPPSLVEMKGDVLAYLGHRLLVLEERTLELLQGLLVLLSWGDLRNFHDEQVTNLTYLALGYAHNLGITRTPPALLQLIGMNGAPDDVQQSKNELMVQHKLHSYDEQRAFLGCYCLLSVNSTQFGRQSPLGRSQYVDLCWDTLGRAREHQSDVRLVWAVRMTQIGEKISEAFGAASDFERGEPYLFLLESQSQAFRTEIDGLIDLLRQEQMYHPAARDRHANLAEPDRWARCLTLHHNYLLVRLYEPATRLQEVTAASGTPSLFRAQCLHSCLLAATAYFDTVFTLDASHWLYQSITGMEQITFVLVIASRLLLLAGPGWDLAAARRTLDLAAVMRRLVEHMEAAEEERVRGVRRFVQEMGVPASGEDMAAQGRLGETIKKLRWIGSWFEKRIAGDKEAAGGPGKGGDGGDQYEGGGQGLAEEEASDTWKLTKFGGGPIWFGGLLPGSTWTFDDVDM